jgi:hypothetical protein
VRLKKVQITYSLDALVREILEKIMWEIEGVEEWGLYGSCLVQFTGHYGLITMILSLITR